MALTLVSGAGGSDPGWMMLCVRDILHWGATHAALQGISVTLMVSYLEVYNEEINDLLGVPGRSYSKNLKIVAEDPSPHGKGVVIGNLVEEVVAR